MTRPFFVRTFRGGASGARRQRGGRMGEHSLTRRPLKKRGVEAAAHGASAEGRMSPAERVGAVER